MESQESGSRVTYNKGKGKAGPGDVGQQEVSSAPSSSQSNGSKNLLGGLFSGPSAGQGMLQDLAQGLSAAAGGKGGQLVSSSARLGGQGQALETLGAQGSSSGGQGTHARQANGQFRSLGNGGQAKAVDQEAYEAFAQSTQAVDGRLYDQIPATAVAPGSENRLQRNQVYTSAADFDGPLYAHVRASHSLPLQREAQEPVESLADEFSRLHSGLSGTQEGFEQAWSTAEQPRLAATPVAPTQDSADGFLAALEAEEAEFGPVTQEPSLPAMGNSQDFPLERPPAAQQAPVSEFLTQHVGMTPEAVQSGSITEEQYQMHLALDALQNSDADPARISERLRPADDDEQAQQGVYAPTPEEALRGILGGEDEVAQENQRAQASKTEQLRRAQEAQATPSELERLRQYLPRGTFVDVSWVVGILPTKAESCAIIHRRSTVFRQCSHAPSKKQSPRKSRRRRLKRLPIGVLLLFEGSKRCKNTCRARLASKRHSER